MPGPGGCLSKGGVPCPGGSARGGGAWSRGVGIPACTEADPPLGETATAADGTHPTEMHSCCRYILFTVRGREHISVTVRA